MDEDAGYDFEGFRGEGQAGEVVGGSGGVVVGEGCGEEDGCVGFAVGVSRLRLWGFFWGCLRTEDLLAQAGDCRGAVVG